MKLGFVGLGRMGLNMVTRLLGSGEHELVVYNRSTSAIDEAVKLGAVGSDSLADLVGKLESPKVVWLMIPSGAPVDGAIEELIPLLSEGDTIVDGGNSNYKETVARGAMLKEHSIDYLDVGTSGGIWGLKVGYCMMIGGEKETFERLEPALKTLAPPNGYSHMGASGAGHYVKMVHNGIEYGMLQAYAEGFALMEASEYGLDLKNIATLWNQGSVVRSWLLELTEDMFEKNPTLDGIKDYVADSGEGRWTILDSMDKDIPCPVITLSLLQRFESRLDSSFSAKVIAGLRDEFGGHGVKK
ncbi:MAG: decarboxylating 6-phosphogluconate dehydrogenase [Proteobacteria bacterium]|nr:decarboxylating 6-phosphogluconate dehydrogenase [Pseudomonadota bacterium]